MRLISVIVPVYNVEDYLEQCIESITNQTYSELQIILIDDGSTDNSGEICDRYALIDDRIEVIHKKNEGLVSARKSGAAVARGEYVAFVDGDDWIDCDTFQRLMEVGQGADIITFACIEEYETYQLVETNTIEEGLYDSKDKRIVLYESMLLNHHFFEFGIMPHLCDKLIKRHIWKENQLNVSDSVSYGEDAACVYPCLIDASAVYVTNLPMYHYRQRTGSIVKSGIKIAKKNFADIYNLLETKFNLAPLGREKLQEHLEYYMWFILLVKAYDVLNKDALLFPFKKVSPNMRLIIYGAGGFGKTIKGYCDNSDNISVSGWVDLHYANYRQQGLDVTSIEQIQNMEYDCVVIAILNESVAETIKDELIQRGVAEERIDWVKKEILKHEKIPEWIKE